MENFIAQHTFLVTGGAGFIGSHLVDFLLKHQAKKVVVLDDLSTGSLDNLAEAMLSPHFSLIKGDICSYETCLAACQGIDFVLHQAALGAVARSIQDPFRTHEVNVQGFMNMLKAVKSLSIKKMVYASSSSVYGNTQVFPQQEDKLGQLLSPYACTKYINEIYAQIFFQTYRTNCIGLRYFNVFGPRQNPNGMYAAVIPRFIKALLQEEQAQIYGSGEQSRDFTYIDNVVHANMLALMQPTESLQTRVFNIACGENLSLNNLWTCLNQLQGTSLLPQYCTERQGDIRQSWASIALAEKHLGYVPQVYSRAGLARTLAWHKTQMLTPTVSF